MLRVLPFCVAAVACTPVLPSALTAPELPTRAVVVHRRIPVDPPSFLRIGGAITAWAGGVEMAFGGVRAVEGGDGLEFAEQALPEGILSFAQSREGWFFATESGGLWFSPTFLGAPRFLRYLPGAFLASAPERDSVFFSDGERRAGWLDAQAEHYDPALERFAVVQADPTGDTLRVKTLSGSLCVSSSGWVSCEGGVDLLERVRQSRPALERASELFWRRYRASMIGSFRYAGSGMVIGSQTAYFMDGPNPMERAVPEELDDAVLSVESSEGLRFLARDGSWHAWNVRQGTVSPTPRLPPVRPDDLSPNNHRITPAGLIWGAADGAKWLDFEQASVVALGVDAQDATYWIPAEGFAATLEDGACIVHNGTQRMRLEGTGTVAEVSAAGRSLVMLNSSGEYAQWSPGSAVRGVALPAAGELSIGSNIWLLKGYDASLFVSHDTGRHWAVVSVPSGSQLEGEAWCWNDVCALGDVLIGPPELGPPTMSTVAPLPPEEPPANPWRVGGGGELVCEDAAAGPWLARQGRRFTLPSNGPGRALRVSLPAELLDVERAEGGVNLWLRSRREDRAIVDVFRGGEHVGELWVRGRSARFMRPSSGWSGFDGAGDFFAVDRTGRMRRFTDSSGPGVEVSGRTVALLLRPREAPARVNGSSGRFVALDETRSQTLPEPFLDACQGDSGRDDTHLLYRAGGAYALARIVSNGSPCIELVSQGGRYARAVAGELRSAYGVCELRAE
ncbi:MAG: hypothetical protein AAF645_04795 [Myxococcota bacterium]